MRPGQRRVIPGGEPGGDVADVASHAAQRRDHRIDRRLRIFGGVLVAGKALFLVVDDQARAVRLRHLDQRHAGIVRARQARGPRDRGSRRARAFRGRSAIRASAKSRAELMKAGGAPSFARRASARREIRRRRASDVAGQFVFAGFQAIEPRDSPVARHASIIIGGGNNAVSCRGITPMLACAARDLRHFDKCKINRLPTGRERCRLVSETLLPWRHLPPLAMTATAAQRAKEIRSGRQRYRDQDRQHHAL